MKFVKMMNKFACNVREEAETKMQKGRLWKLFSQPAFEENQHQSGLDEA